MYGYEITQRVKILFQDKIQIKEASLYPSLHQLKDEGLVKTDEEVIGNRVRKYYFQTEKGKLSTEEKVNELQEFMGTLQNIMLNQVLTS